MQASGDTEKAVLVVEDDLMVKVQVRRWLFDAGHQCVAVDSAEQGCTVLAGHGSGFWLVVFDVRITGKFSGVELLDRVVQMAHEKKLQTIMMSSSGEVIALALNRGCDEFMMKPLRKELFLKRVENLKALTVLRDKDEAGPNDAVEQQNDLTVEKLLYFWTEPKTHAFPMADVNERALDEVKQWSFNVFNHSEVELLVLAKHMFVHLNLLEFSHVPEGVWENFLVAVRQSCTNDNPYHNWRHAFDSLQAAFVFVVRYGSGLDLTPVEQLGILIASLCQDLGHPGCNNEYLIKTESEVAALYNHRSVLENCHSFMLCQMLDKRDDLNILAGLSKDDKSIVKSLLMEGILSTDPGAQVSCADKLSAIDSIETKNPQYRLAIMQCIIKMADVSNVARDWDVGFWWSFLAAEEAFNQGDTLRSCGITIPASLDREATSKAQNSKNLIDTVSMPLFKALGRLVPKFKREVVSILAENRRKWVKEIGPT
jgi:FixJ family two-component response regulator